MNMKYMITKKIIGLIVSINHHLQFLLYKSQLNNDLKRNDNMAYNCGDEKS